MGRPTPNMVNANSFPFVSNIANGAEKAYGAEIGKSSQEKPGPEKACTTETRNDANTAEQAYSAEKMSWLQQIGELSRHAALDWLRDAAPPAAREDRDLILAAIEACGAGAMHLAARKLRRDREFVLTAVGLNGFALGAAALSLQADREFVLEAVARDGDALDEAAPELRADRGVVLAAVSQRGIALRFAAPAMQADREILLAAAAQDPRVLVDHRIARSGVCPWSTNRAFVMAVVRQNGLALSFVGPRFQAERDMVLAAVGQNGKALRFAAPGLQADSELGRIAKGEYARERLGEVVGQVPVDHDVRREN